MSIGLEEELNIKKRSSTSMIALDIGPMAISRKALKKGIEFTILVVGEKGLGKSTLINTLLNTEVCYSEPVQLTNSRNDMQIRVSTLEIEEKASKIRLSVVDTPGFGDAIDNTNMSLPIIEYIDKQFECYFNDETGLNRRSLVDNRVHCCLYFIEPMNAGLKSIDIEFMRAVQDKVNIIPLLAKADAYTNRELVEMKKRLIKDFQKNDIKIYEFPVCDEEDDPAFIQLNEEMKKLVPFSVIGATDTIEVAGKKMRGRKYPWGFVNIENEEHSDFVFLRTMLLRTHIHDLREVTEEIFYENFRTSLLTQGQGNIETTSRKKTSMRRSYAESPQSLSSLLDVPHKS